MAKHQVTTFAEWYALPQLPIPTHVDSKGKGVVYRVLKVGFFSATTQECESKNLSAELNHTTGKCHLPTTFIRDAKGNETLYKLPFDLLEWAETMMGMAMMGMNHLPCDIEFALKEDRNYAEML